MFYPLVELESQNCAFAGLVIKVTFDIDASDDLKDFDGYFQYLIQLYFEVLLLQNKAKTEIDGNIM